MSTSRSLNQFIEEIAQAGEFDSDGVFTLDVERAADKMQRFRLVDPYLYVAHLVSVATLSQSRNLVFTKSASEVRVEFDGAPFDLESLEILNHGLLADFSGERRVQELAIAVMGARATEPARLVWESAGEDSQGVRLSYQGEKRVLERIQAPRGNRLTLDYPLSWKRLRGRFDAKSPELDVLRTFCSRAPLSIQTDQGLLSQEPFGPQEFLAWKYWRGSEIDPKLSKPSRPTGYCASVSWREPYSAVLCLTNPIYSEVQELTIVLNGVSFRREKVLGCPYACGVVYVSHLTKNVSHTDLVEDAAYHELIDGLCARVDELWREFADSHLSLPQLMADRVSSYLRRRYPSEDRPLSVRRYLLRYELDGQILGVDKGEEFLEEAARFEEAGDREQAALVRTKIIDSTTRLLCRDYSSKLEPTSPKLASLRARALQGLNGRADPEAQELFRITAALMGQRVEPLSNYHDDWFRLRAVLISLATGEEEAARKLLESLDKLEAWKLYLTATLNGDLDMYLRAANAAPDSSYFWNEAASAQFLAGSTKQAIQCRIKAVEALPNDEPYFIRKLANELSGKAPFTSWVAWSIKAQFRPHPLPRVFEIEKSLSENRIVPRFALEALEQYHTSTYEYAFLAHSIVWSWTSHKEVDPQAIRQFLAKSILRRTLIVTTSSVRLGTFSLLR